MDKIRAGIAYRSAGQRVDVEAGSRTIGRTSHDVKSGHQVFWFASLAEFEAAKWDIFEAPHPLNIPVPIFELVEDNRPATTTISDTPQVTQSAAPSLQLPPPPPPPAVVTPEQSATPDSAQNFIFEKHAGRNIRIKEFAAELNAEPATVQALIESDPRFAPMIGGWVRLKKETAPTI